MIPGILAQRRRSGSTPGVWTPLNLSAAPQIYLHAQNSELTTVGGGCSLISNLGAMGSAGDFVQTVEANRPVVLGTAVNGKRALRFDGVNDYMLAPSTPARQVFKGVAHAWAFVVFNRRAATTGQTRVLLYGSVGNSSGARFACWAGFSGQDNKLITRGVRLDAEAGASVVSSVTFSGYTMALLSVDYTTRAATVVQDATVRATADSPSSVGLTSDTTAQDPLAICGFPAGTGGFADVDLASIAVGNTELTGADIDRLFGWAAHEFGLTAKLPAGHPYKTTAPTT